MDEIGYKSEEMREDEAWEQMRARGGKDVCGDLRKRGADGWGERRAKRQTWGNERRRRSEGGGVCGGAQDKVIEFLSLCFYAPLHPHMALPRTEICTVLKALYHLVQTFNINQYSSYFIFSFVPWVASFNNTVMWPTSAPTPTHTHTHTHSHP